MNNLKTFESFSRDVFGLPFFSEVSDEEGEKIDTMVYDTLKEFENSYFEMDEPSLGFGSNDDPENKTRSDYWLANSTVRDLRILNDSEMSNLESTYPKKRHNSIMVNGREHAYEFAVIYGNFIYYSIKGPKRQYRIWMIGKDEDHLFRSVDAEYVYGKTNTTIRDAWDSAKQWDDLDALLASQIPHLKSIGKYVQEHCKNEDEEKEEVKRDYDDDPNAGLEPWR